MNGSPNPPGLGPSDPDFFRAVLEHSQDLVTVVNPAGEIQYASAAVRGLLGYEPEERIGGTGFDLLHPDDRSALRAYLARIADKPSEEVTREFRVRHRDGDWRILRATGRNLVDHPVIGGFLINVRDVTGLRSAEAEVSRTRSLLQEVVDHAPVVLWKVDADGMFELSEGRGLEALGLEPGEVVGQSAFELYGDNEDVVELLRSGLRGDAMESRLELAGRTFETRIRPVHDGDEVVGAVGMALDITEWAEGTARAEFHSRLLDSVGEAVIATDSDGRVIYWNRTAEELYGWTREEAMGRSVADLTVPEPSHGSAVQILAQIKSGRRWSGEHQVKRKDGSTFTAFVSNVPIFEDDELLAIIGVSTDLTEQRELETRLRQAQKMEAVGQLAGGIAHEFNNLLTAIGGYAALAAEHTTDAQVAADLTEITAATNRARGLATKLLAFSRQRTARTEATDPNAVIRGMMAMLKRAVGEDIRVILNTTDRPWLARMDTGLAEQAILNLALNARDAMPDGGVLTLSTERVTLDAGRAAELDAGLAPGDYMRLVVEDSGGGIEPGAQERIFEPFFTTKEVGKGSGLGLSIVFGAVRQVGGGVTVESEPGSGSRFTLYFPRADAEAGDRSDDATGAAEADVASSPRVLVVEDELAVLALVKRVLIGEGYRVLEASSGEEARRMILDADESVDLVVTDVIMPEMGGPELVQRLRREDPGIRSVFMSGYAADELEARGLSREEEHFLPKPFTPQDLKDAVRKALQD